MYLNELWSRCSEWPVMASLGTLACGDGLGGCERTVGGMAQLTRELLLQVPIVNELLSLCDFPQEGETLVCAVSGGADSTAMLVLAVAAGCEVTAVHVDHQLREGSADEARVVEAVARMLGAGFASEQVTVGAGPNLEARAREARYGVLPADVATGHTMDDQAETVLLNLVRGAGPAGLRGIEPGPRHPILRLRRSDTVNVCETLNLPVVHDPTNDEVEFRRNKMRHLVLPLLCEVADRDVVPLLARSASRVRDMYEVFDGEVTARVKDPTDTRDLLAAGDVVARHALHRWLVASSVDGKTIDSATVDRAMRVVRGEVLATQLPGGRTLRRTRGKLYLSDK